MKSITKTQTVADCLLERISCGFYPDGRLPREIDLAAEFKVGRITVRRALELLQHDDLIERKKHAGTFFRGSLRKINSAHPVGVIMRTSGHLYADLHHFIIRKLMDHGFSANVISASSADGTGKMTPMTRAVANLIKAKLQGLIISGSINTQLPYFDKLLKMHPVFFDFYDSGEEPKATGVWFDHEKAGYLGGNYLMKSGCRHPLLICHPLPPSVRLNPAAYAQHREKMIIAGFRRALLEYGLEADQHILDPSYLELGKRDKVVEELMRNRKLRPDGILGSEDSLLLKPLKMALWLDLKIPKEFLVVGIGNTPWSDKMAILPFSSIDLQLEKCAEKLVEQICLPPKERKNIYIEPTLITRSNMQMGVRNSLSKNMKEGGI